MRETGGAVVERSEADLAGPIEIAPRVWWVGAMRPESTFQCHVYLIEQGDQSVLIDPGSTLVIDDVVDKVTRVLGEHRVRWLVCSTPEIETVGGLGPTLERVTHPDAEIVTSWHNWLSISQLGPPWEVHLVDGDDDKLVLEDRTLHFEWMPFVPCVGAFVTFDQSTGVLFSSGLFGGLTPDAELWAGDNYYEAVKPYHQHYLASSDVLGHALDRVGQLPVTLIAPHRGQLVRAELIEDLSRRLGRLESGLATLRGTDANLRFVLGANRIIRRVADALVHEQRFSDVVAFLDSLARRTAGATSLELWAGTRERLLHFDASDEFAGRPEEPPPAVARALEGLASPPGEQLILPIVTPQISQIHGAVVLNYAGPVSIDEAVLGVVQQIIGLVGVGLEREVLRRSTDLELDHWRQRAVLDTLTGLRNRASLDEAGRRLMAMDDQRLAPGVGALMIDIDYFKTVNDSYGHPVGDRVLRAVASAITESVRPSDVAFRYGGEEFLVLLSSVDEPSARRAAERIRARVALGLEDGLAVSVSVGVAIRERGERYEALVERADHALYAAKQNGRDRVEVL